MGARSSGNMEHETKSWLWEAVSGGQARGQSSERDILEILLGALEQSRDTTPRSNDMGPHGQPDVPMCCLARGIY